MEISWSSSDSDRGQDLRNEDSVGGAEDKEERPISAPTSTATQTSETCSSNMSQSQYPVIPFNRLSISTNLGPSSRQKEFKFNLPQHPGFTSFAISSAFPDFVHSVDVISDAENIKKLLKIPFADPSTTVSMVVHRIGKSLLIDDLDIAKYLLLTQDPDWKWLKKVLLSAMKPEALQRNTSETPLERNLLLQFLSQSLSTNALLPCSKPLTDTGRTVDAHKVLPPLPEPSVEEQVPRRNPFARNIVWNFEDIRMLIGSDMPIFGDAEHPCVSLRLRNAKNPINILTGLDYWLDNLMCQVPEVLMCFHVDGIVQRYELYKTEDLPSLGGCKFSPTVVRDVARNILSFLRSNATQEGHTYWLFKAQNEDVVKLYDLTSLGEDFKAKMFMNSGENQESHKESDILRNAQEENGNNPFKTAVSMLLYKVARNLMQSDQRKFEMSTVRRLLKNCLALLDSKKYPQIATSAHYMLSDLLVPDEINPAYPDFPVFEIDTHESDEKERRFVSDIDIRTLMQSNNNPSLTDSKSSSSKIKAIPNENIKPDGHETVARCKKSLIHVVEGFKYLDVIISQEENKNGIKSSNEENPKMCNPNEVIPMPYNSKTDDYDKSENNTKSMKIQIYVKNEEQPPVWHEHFKTILFKKSFLVYVTLAELNFSEGRYGSVLKGIKRALEIGKILKSSTHSNFNSDPNIAFSSFAWGVAGDSYMSMVKQWSDLVGYHEQYNSNNEADHCLSERIESEHREWIVKFPIDMEEAMLLAAQCFKKAEEILRDKESYMDDYLSILKRLGNVENEVGVFYMNHASNLCQNSTSSLEPHIKELFSKSLLHLEEGIIYFEKVKDSSNISLLNSNIGRLCRLYAYYGGCGNIDDRTEFSDFEFEQYSKAIEHYEIALKTVGNRKNNPLIWDSISWDLSSTLFTVGSLLQDFAPLSTKPKSEVEKLISDYFVRALKYCDLENKGPKLPIYQHEAGRIHHRLASMYHKSYRGDYVVENETRRHHLKQLAELHYSKAENLFLILEDQVEYLKIMAERIGLIEFQMESTTTLPKLKVVKQIFDVLFRSIVMFENLKAEEVEVLDKEKLKIIKILVQRLQHALLSLNKILLGKKNSKHRDNTWCKLLYSKSLKLNVESEEFNKCLASFLTELKSVTSDHM
ncbi:erythroid differentiation-related factor 1 [Lepeophtheirus salmonis]|uniref:erythroid differentiation-related factor 1 n=1 Tax=Lepeophtheirus salmonis TaxID=72036 RepID=UPI001AE293CC|nr:erythroid differentiation-related factor 1-like [Lepeophtheirus salmonis]